MKKITLSLSIIALIIAVTWTIRSNFEPEPIITTITLFIAIIAINARVNNLNIKGEKNQVKQDSRNGSSNNTTIEGDNNKVSQF